jgi:hypothetical protein
LVHPFIKRIHHDQPWLIHRREGARYFNYQLTKGIGRAGTSHLRMLRFHSLSKARQSRVELADQTRHKLIRIARAAVLLSTEVYADHVPARLR